LSVKVKLIQSWRYKTLAVMKHHKNQDSINVAFFTIFTGRYRINRY